MQHSWQKIHSWQEIIVLCSDKRVNKTSAVKAFDGIQHYYRGQICSRVFSCLGDFWEEDSGAANNWGIPAGALALAAACRGKKWQGASVSIRLLARLMITTELLRSAAPKTSPLAGLCTLQVPNIKGCKEKLQADLVWWALCVSTWKDVGVADLIFLTKEALTLPCWQQKSLVCQLVSPVPVLPLPSFFMCLV